MITMTLATLHTPLSTLSNPSSSVQPGKRPGSVPSLEALRVGDVVEEVLPEGIRDCGRRGPAVRELVEELGGLEEPRAVHCMAESKVLRDLP